MAPTNPRIPDYLGIYKPDNSNIAVKNGTENNKNSVPENSVFDLGGTQDTNNAFEFKTNTDVEFKELSLKEQKAQAKAKLKELKAKAKLLAKEAAKKDASQDIKDAALQAQNEVEAQAQKTYRIRKAYAKSIGQDTPKETVQKTEKQESKIENKTSVQEPQKQQDEKKSMLDFVKQNVMSQFYSDKKSVEPKKEQLPAENKSEQLPVQNKSEQNGPSSFKVLKNNFTSSTQNMSVIQEDSSVCDSVSDYWAQKNKEINNRAVALKAEVVAEKSAEKVVEKPVEKAQDGPIKIYNKEACEEFEKASNDAMKGAFSVSKSSDGCEVDFDANKSNEMHDINDNSFVDDIVDFFKDVEKVDYSTIDGKLGTYYQKIGDCYLITAMRDSEIDLKSLIKSKSGDNKPPFEVTFPTNNEKLKPFAKQTVTAEDIEKNSKYSKGDVEARIIEIALNKAIGKQLTTEISNITKNSNNQSEIRKAVRKALFDVGLPGAPAKAAFIEVGDARVAKEILTGKEHKNYNLTESNKKELEDLIQKGKITAFGLKNPNDSIRIFGKGKLIGGHSYTIKDVKVDKNGETKFTIDCNWEPSGLFGSYGTTESMEISLSKLMKYKDKFVLK